MGDQNIVLNKLLRDGALETGVLSVSNQHVVARMPTIEEGHNSAVLVARDARQNGVMHRFYFRKRAPGGYAKQTLTRMRRYFRLHTLRDGDRIMIYLVRREFKLFGRVIRPAIYSIDFERAGGPQPN